MSGGDPLPRANIDDREEEGTVIGSRKTPKGRRLHEVLDNSGFGGRAHSPQPPLGTA